MTIEVLSGLERKFNFTISKDDVQAVAKEKLKKYAKTAKMQGFRPGKVPANIVEQMYGQQAFEEALNEKIEKTYVELVLEHKVNVAGYPKFDLANNDENQFNFTATFEVLPEFALGDFANIEVEKPVCDITDEIVEKTIEILRKQRATYEDSTDAATDGDRVVIDFVGTIDGVEFEGGKSTNYPFIIGQKQMLSDFEDGVLGLMPNETRVVNVRFPDEYHAENLKGKTAQFSITLKSVSKAVLPELTQEFIETLGVKDGDATKLRAEIKQNLGYEVNRRLNSVLRSNVLQSLDKWISFDVPHAMVHDEIHHMMDETREKAKKQGYKDDQIKLTHEMFEENAKRLVKLRLLVQKIIKEHDISISDEDTKQWVTEIAHMYEDASEYIKWYFQDKNRVEQAKNAALEKKVTDTVLSKAKCTDVTISYEELMQETQPINM